MACFFGTTVFKCTIVLQTLATDSISLLSFSLWQEKVFATTKTANIFLIFYNPWQKTEFATVTSICRLMRYGLLWSCSPHVLSGFLSPLLLLVKVCVWICARMFQVRLTFHLICPWESKVIVFTLLWIKFSFVIISVVSYEDHCLLYNNDVLHQRYNCFHEGIISH